ncbi:hypothetical protein Syun_012148 [Stephania yunnanensis]|uniref:Uncharacterized protein n=1 Tax=Stephania yunnanensis TaxID=152371 RepID=A0AAP0PF15_9MAGN
MTVDDDGDSGGEARASVGIIRRRRRPKFGFPEIGVQEGLSDEEIYQYCLNLTEHVTSKRSTRLPSRSKHGQKLSGTEITLCTYESINNLVVGFTCFLQKVQHASLVFGSVSRVVEGNRWMLCLEISYEHIIGSTYGSWERRALELVAFELLAKTITYKVIERYGKANGYDDTYDEREKAEIARRETKQKRKIRDDTRRIMEKLSEARNDRNMEQPTRNCDGLCIEQRVLAFNGAILCNQMTALNNPQLVS